MNSELQFPGLGRANPDLILEFLERSIIHRCKYGWVNERMVDIIKLRVDMDRLETMKEEA